MSWRDIAADFLLDSMQMDANMAYTDAMVESAKKEAAAQAKLAAANAAYAARDAAANAIHDAAQNTVMQKIMANMVPLDEYNEMVHRHNNMVVARNEARKERDAAKAERDAAKAERDALAKKLEETKAALKQAKDDLRVAEMGRDSTKSELRCVSKVLDRERHDSSKTILSQNGVIERLTLENAELSNALTSAQRSRDHYRQGFEHYERMLEESRDEAQTYRGAFEASVAASNDDSLTVSTSDALKRLREGAKRYTESRGEITPEQLTREYEAMSSGAMRADNAKLREMRDQIMYEAGAALAARHKEGDTLGATKLSSAVRDATESFTEADDAYHESVRTKVSDSAITAGAT